MEFKNKWIIFLLITLIAISSISIVSASMEIEGGSFSTNGGLEDKTYASIYVGDEYSGDDVVIQIFYSRDGSLLNNGDLVLKTVNSDGYIEVVSADAYKYFPDHAEINLFDTNNTLLDCLNVSLSPSSGVQTFGFDESATSSTHTSSESSYNTGTSDSYVGNVATGKFHASGCGDVNKMKNSNKIYFSSRQEAINSGYSPCGHCHP